MDLSLSQSSCEIITDIKNLEVCSETENFSSQFSEITEKVEKLEVDSNQQETLKTDVETEETTIFSVSSGTESSTEASSESSSSSQEAEAPKKRKRKRKRRRKKNQIAAYSPPEPFTARYKRIKRDEPIVQPKLHIRFDLDGMPDIKTSEYNFKPRIIRALEVNIATFESFLEIINESTSTPDVSETIQEKFSIGEPEAVCLKPRIIHAIVV